MGEGGAPVLRPMQRSDLDAVMEIERVSFETPWSRWSYAAELKSPFSTYLVLELEGRLAGYIGAKRIADELHIMTVAVRPDCRRQGWARRLLRAVLEANPGVVRVHLEVRRGNYPARRLYESLGFEPVGVRPRYYEGREDAILMSLNL
ncbi:ribosomal-protein-alanine N-acetyltransferase [Rubrobacter taiwanensis]|uniref:[Ribosomal protein bS18]-alanine N-acetyltransferase n=2 Tax=Rubrobacter taiwanensis TaxID=185139 RepID=A0A4R1BEX3_9ACTN|nr:ribosomal-protein-alanine N-acetyltransferase [Rubrobacter taiwanensis]